MEANEVETRNCTNTASRFTAIEQRIAERNRRQALDRGRDSEPPKLSDNKANLDETIVKLLEFSGDSDENVVKAISNFTTDYLELVDWSGRAIVEGKCGKIPDHLPPILARLNIDPDNYIRFINRTQKHRFHSFIGAVDNMQALAHQFGRDFLKPALFTTLPSRGVVRPSGGGDSRPSAPQAYSTVR